MNKSYIIKYQNSTIEETILNLISGTILVGIEGTIFFGNGLVILAVLTTKRLQTVTNLYVLSLAFSDLLVSIFVLPLAIVTHIIKYWPLSSMVCKLWLSCDICLCTSSILNLCCISIDRYMAITQPLKYATRRSKKLARIMIFIVWLLALIITVPGGFGWTKHVSSTRDCLLTLHQGYRLFSASFSFLIPFFIMIFVYIRIFWVAYKRKLLTSPEPSRCMARLKSEGISLTNSLSNCDDVTSINNKVKLINPTNNSKSLLRFPNVNSKETSGSTLSNNKFKTQIKNVMQTPRQMTLLQKSLNESDCVREMVIIHLICINHSSQFPLIKKRVRFNENDRKKERAAFRKEHKTAKTLALVVGCFSICWLPFFIVYLLEPFCRCTINTHLMLFVTWLGYVNSIFNPFIYAFYNKEYSIAFRRLICILKK